MVESVAYGESRETGERESTEPLEAAHESRQWGLAALVFGIALALYAAIGYGIYLLVTAL
jgi:hypothetical protein